MNNFTKIALVTLFVTTFTLFLGWVPIGALIPQVVFILVALIMRPKAFSSKTMVLYYIFFLYQFVLGFFFGGDSDIIIWVSKFLTMAIPLVISSSLFTPQSKGDCRFVSKYALIVSFITVLLSIRVLINDGTALRTTSMANSMGDWDLLYHYWRMGMADYAMAAMMMLMPVVLVFALKYSDVRKHKYLFYAGIVTIIVFMFLGQVTTTFVLCLMATILSLVDTKNRAFSVMSVFLIIIFCIVFFTGIMDYAISATTGSEMNEKFSSVAGVSSGEALDEASDAGIRWMLTMRSINSFISHPLLGSVTAKIGGHNYFLDILAKYGIIGCLPFFLLIKNQYKLISSFLSDNAKRFYLIMLLFFILHGVIKNMSGTEYWNYLFIYYPAILVWFDTIKQHRIR